MIMKNNSQSMRARALKVIPNGNSLLSKRSEMFSPEKWPGYFKIAKGIEVIDLDDNSYKDFSHFSVGTCTLGYNNFEVNSAVINSINQGTMSTLNCPEEVLLAEKLVEMHPWSSMARFARTGGEANMMAIRIARSYTKKDKILINGYHGWHDWYLSLNLNGEMGLDHNLLPGLSPVGVPKQLKNSVDFFETGDLAKIKKELSTGDYAALKMEVMRNHRPTEEYLKEIREICDINKVLLIFDECTSGFREAFGGMHLNYSVSPDICVLGKTIGNGFPLTCVLGSEEIMKESASTFMSSTFWTERIGFVASLKTLEIMEKEKSWSRITELGEFYKKSLNKVFEELELNYEWSGMPALIGYQIKGCSWPSLKTFIVEEFLEKGYLHGALFYPSIKHTEESITEFSLHFKEILIKAINKGFKSIEKDYRGIEAHNTFKRLN